MDLELIASDIERQDGLRDPTSVDLEALDAYSRTVIGAEERVGPAVVSVGVARQAPERWRRRGLPELRGGGSGVVIAPDGYVLTNSHVVRAGQKIDVTLQDGRAHEGRILGDDRRQDQPVRSARPGRGRHYHPSVGRPRSLRREHRE